MAEEDKVTEEESKEPQNPLEMSDEDILNMEPEEFAAQNAASSDDNSTEEDEDEEKVPDSEEEDETDEEEVTAKADETFSDEEVSDEPTAKTDDSEQETESDKEAKAEDKSETVEKKSEIDYKTEYEKLLAPFTASGKEHQVQNVDEAIRLMQFGVDYHKKSARIKELKRVIQPLEDHKLLTDDNISLFIDLVAKKDQNALKKLIKDHGIDPMEIDTEDSSEYKPNTYTVDESRVELDEVLDELKASPHYTNILDIVGNKWDDASKQRVAQQPTIMAQLNEQMLTGVYDKVAAEVERQRMFGHLKGVSDLDAYNTVGAYLAKQGAFQEPKSPLETPNEDEITPAAVSTKKTNPELNSRRKAAATTKSMPSGQKAPQQNPLAMSDEDFLKQGP